THSSDADRRRIEPKWIVGREPASVPALLLSWFSVLNSHLFGPPVMPMPLSVSGTAHPTAGHRAPPDVGRSTGTLSEQIRYLKGAWSHSCNQEAVTVSPKLPFAGRLDGHIFTGPALCRSHALEESWI